MDTEKRTKKLIGEDVYKKLVEACRHPEYLPAVSNMLYTYHQRNADFDLTQNLLVNLIRTAIQSQSPHPADATGKAQALVKSLGLDEATRERLYECLFDSNGIYSLSIRIHR